MRKLSLLLIALAIIGATMFVTVPAAYAASPEAENSAKHLNALGLFQGTAKGFELDRAPNRAEALVMLIRLLGVESEATAKAIPHPFKDVPAWADRYVGFAYANGLTKGKSATEFGTADLATSSQYLTFLLRALGYNDAAGDFRFDQVHEKAQALELIQLPEIATLKKKFTRGDAAALSFRTLERPLKQGDKVLVEALIDKGAVKKDDALKQGLLFKGELPQAPQFTLYYATTTRTGHPTGVTDLIAIHMFPESSFSNETSYVRINGGEWREFPKADYNAKAEVNFESSPYESRFVRGNNFGFWILDHPESRIEIMVTFDWNGKTYRSITATFQTPSTFWQRYSLNGPGDEWRPSGGRGGEPPEQQLFIPGAGNMPIDLIDWTWYRSDKLEGPYEVMEGVKGPSYGQGGAIFPVKQGDYFYLLGVPKIETGVTGWTIVGPYQYK